MELAVLQSDVRSARDRFMARVQTIGADIWAAALSEADPRPVAIVCDHVAHSYEYLGGWLSDLKAGRTPVISPQIVDELNRVHAQAPLPTRSEVIEHLRTSGDTFLTVAESMGEEDLELGDGLAGRILQIAGRHPDDHRAEIEQVACQVR